MKILMIILGCFYSLHAFSYENIPQSDPEIYGSADNVKCPIEIVPKKAIGPIEIGRSIKEIDGLGMKIKSVDGSRTMLVVGKYSVGLDDANRVNRVEAKLGDLPDCLTYGGKKLNKKMNSRQLARVFSNCGKEEKAFGGTTTECNGISIGTGGWGGRQKTPSLKILAQESSVSPQ